MTVMTQSILAGLALAAVESAFSIGALRWARSKRIFYWVWGGGIFFRLFFFGLAAFVLIQYTPLNWVASLITMVLATTLLLVIDYGFSSRT
jgi:hypothetical protein